MPCSFSAITWNRYVSSKHYELFFLCSQKAAAKWVAIQCERLFYCSQVTPRTHIHESSTRVLSVQVLMSESGKWKAARYSGPFPRFQPIAKSWEKRKKKRKNEQKVTFIKGERKNGKTVKRCTNLCNVMNNSFLVIFIVVYRQHVKVGNKNKGAKVMNLAL